VATISIAAVVGPGKAMGPNSEQQMIEEQAIQEPDIDLFKAVGKLADADYQAFIPQLESLINAA
jgi:hypothetical protein